MFNFQIYGWAWCPWRKCNDYTWSKEIFFGWLFLQFHVIIPGKPNKKKNWRNYK